MKIVYFSVMVSAQLALTVMKVNIRTACNVLQKYDHFIRAIQCTSCQKLVHKKCSGMKGSMSKVMKSFICRGCLNPVTSTGHTSVDIDASANLELVDKFCYLGDM